MICILLQNWKTQPQNVGLICAFTHAVHEQKNKQLFLRQKKLRDTFLDRFAISQVQYNKSLGDLQAKTDFVA